MPAGDALFGSSNPERIRLWENAVPIHLVQTEAYFIAKRETTYAEWIAFLESLPVADERRRLQLNESQSSIYNAFELSRSTAGKWQIVLQPTETRLVASWGEMIRYSARTHRNEQDWRRMPAGGLSFDDATEFAQWLDRTGRVPGARLCTEHEWERAARGTSGRKFPHGDILEPDDANFDETYGKQPGGFGPDEVGSHPKSRSPFGIDDLSGNVWEWVVSSLDERRAVIRGGSYYQFDDVLQISNRETPEASTRGMTIGIRICATPR